MEHKFLRFFAQDKHYLFVYSRCTKMCVTSHMARPPPSSVHYAMQRFPTCGSRPHVGSPSIFIGVATGHQTIKKIHAQLHIHNVRFCLCPKLCSVRYSPSNTGSNKIKTSFSGKLLFNEWGRRSSWKKIWGRPMQKVGNHCIASASPSCGSAAICCTGAERGRLEYEAGFGCSSCGCCASPFG